jgi:hypothetical protein
MGAVLCTAHLGNVEGAVYAILVVIAEHVIRADDHAGRTA